MLQRVHIQILDNPMEKIMFDAEKFERPEKNKALVDELRREMDDFYPSMVSVEYIDLFIDDIDFPEIRELLMEGAIDAPVILINGVPRIYGSIPRSVIRDEVEKILSKGPVH